MRSLVLVCILFPDTGTSLKIPPNKRTITLGLSFGSNLTSYGINGNDHTTPHIFLNVPSFHQRLRKCHFKIPLRHPHSLKVRQTIWLGSSCSSKMDIGLFLHSACHPINSHYSTLVVQSKRKECTTEKRTKLIGVKVYRYTVSRQI